MDAEPGIALAVHAAGADTFMLPIREDYRSYTPPAWVKKTVNELLASLSPGHVSGLSAVVLTESSTIRDGKSRRVAERKYALKECLGFYRRRVPGEPPVIFLIVDKIVQSNPPLSWHLPLTRDLFFGQVLFHEVGHHLNATIGPLAAGEETSADAWKKRLGRIHFRRKYWYLRFVITPLRFIARGLKRILSK